MVGVAVVDAAAAAVDAVVGVVVVVESSFLLGVEVLVVVMIAGIIVVVLGRSLILGAMIESSLESFELEVCCASSNRAFLTGGGILFNN